MLLLLLLLVLMLLLLPSSCCCSCWCCCCFCLRALHPRLTDSWGLTEIKITMLKEVTRTKGGAYRRLCSVWKQNPYKTHNKILSKACEWRKTRSECVFNNAFYLFYFYFSGTAGIVEGPVGLHFWPPIPFREPLPRWILEAARLLLLLPFSWVNVTPGKYSGGALCGRGR